jgi:short-subunit dehydrogenase
VTLTPEVSDDVTGKPGRDGAGAVATATVTVVTDRTNPCAVVTGASAGIGRAYAELLAARGFDLVIVGRREDRLRELASQLTGQHGVSVELAACDLASSADLGALAADAAPRVPDLLVNNAGLAHYMPFVDLPEHLARELVDVNVTAPLVLEQAVLPGMVARGSGAIVNVASLLAFSGPASGPGMPQRAVYAATKSFLVTHTQVLAIELAGTGVRVQVVCPGVVATEFHTRQGMDLSAAPRMQPEDVARASLLDLDRGVVVSIPGHPDPEAALDALTNAELGLTSAARATSLPERYAT